jgi:hypothetical protein
MFLSAWIMASGLMKNISGIVRLLSLYRHQKAAKQSR